MKRSSLIEYFENSHHGGREIAYAQRRGYRTLRWSYLQIAETAQQFARELEARQIGKGDRVLLWGENSAEWAACFGGCVLRGAVVVPVDRAASASFAGRLAREIGTRLLVRSRAMPSLEPHLPELVFETLPEILSRHGRSRYASPAFARNDLAEIIFTSGATAEPKGVLLSHGNILASLEPLETEIQKYLKYERFFHPLRLLCLVPLSHVFGQFLGLFVPPLLRATMAFQDTLKPGEILRTMRRERVSALVVVPRLLQLLREKLERDWKAQGELERYREAMRAAEAEHFLKRWWRFRRIHRRFGWKFWAFISGGATLDPETEAFWHRLGFAVIQGYGLTETASLISVSHPFRLSQGSIGKVMPGREVRLDAALDSMGDAMGEILVRGENVAMGYLQGQDQTSVPGADGWFHTGDLGQLDASGHLHFKGRKKNVIVTPEGQNVYPEDLEAALRRQPEVRDCTVVGLARDGNAESCAVLLLRDAAGIPEHIVKRANQSLATYQQVRRWLLSEPDLPRTSTGKPRTSLIQQVVQARQQVLQAPLGRQVKFTPPGAILNTSALRQPTPPVDWRT